MLGVLLTVKIFGTGNATFVALQAARKIALCNMALNLRSSFSCARRDGSGSETVQERPFAPAY